MRGRILDLDLVIVYPYIDRGFRFPLHDESVVACALKLVRPKSPYLALANPPREGRFGSDTGARSSGHGRSSQRTQGEDKLVVGRQGVDSRLRFLQEVVGDEARPSEVFAVEVLLGLVYRDTAVGKVYSEDLAGDTVDHEDLP